MIRTEAHRLDDSITRLLIISDIHAHTTPLQRFDEIRRSLRGRSVVIFSGDMVYGGPDPAEAVDWVRRAAGPLATVGNHDEAMLACGDEEGQGPSYTERGAWQRLDGEQRSYVRALPHRLELSWRGRRIVVTHGHYDPDGRPFPWVTTPEQVTTRFAERGADVCVTSHTHFPFVRELGGTTVANTGSLFAVYLVVRTREGPHLQSGDAHLAADADRRSSFLSITESDGRLGVDVMRFDYDRAAAMAAMEAAGFPDLHAYRRVLMEGIVEE